ncbi:hypothetical protein JOB18_020881 [Solea senegalensis]|uniref:Uncharacterized protein n=1 Tax=Solea senegalensis TaxID=28829 RepID=A0AAV6QMT9_SOLSE|nr:hypothetical protein JOB18_020881 [Solea senegalensis]
MPRRRIPRMKGLLGPPGGAEPSAASIPGKLIGRSGSAVPGSERQFSEGWSGMRNCVRHAEPPLTLREPNVPHITRVGGG